MSRLFELALILTLTGYTVASIVRTKSDPMIASEVMILAHEEAFQLLTSAGVKLSSSGNCIDPANPKCTSLQGIRSTTLNAILNFKAEFGGEVVITGGTEVGHASGTYSHANGYKFDMRHTAEATSYIVTNYEFIGMTPISNWKKYQDMAGNVWMEEIQVTTAGKEVRHWDVLVK